MAKEYVPIFFDWLENTQDLTPEQKGNLIDAVILYATGGDYEAMLQGPEKIAFRFMKGQIDRNSAISDARAKAGSANKQEQSATSESKPEQTETNENKPEQTETNFPKEKEKEKENKKQKTKKEDDNGAFDVFWNAYPRHTNKKAAQTVFMRINPDADLLNIMLQSLAAWSKSPQWTKDGGQFIPHPATWLNGRRWEDELPKAVPFTGKQVSAQQYTQRQYSENELLSVSEDLIAEARKQRDTA